MQECLLELNFLFKESALTAKSSGRTVRDAKNLKVGRSPAPIKPHSCHRALTRTAVLLLLIPREFGGFMKKFLGIIKTRRSLLLASAFTPVCLAMFAGGAGPSRPQSPTRSDLKIINKTTTLDVISVHRTVYNLLVIQIKNVSTKDLNGYALAVNNSRITIDISSGDRVIAPGQTDDLQIPNDFSTPDLTILAAMFADGSIEGDRVIAAELREWRAGLKKELTRALSVLDAALESPDVDSGMTLDNLEGRFSSIGLESYPANPHSASGSQDARNTLNTEIQILRERRKRNGTHMQRQRLLDLRGRIERRIASL